MEKKGERGRLIFLLFVFSFLFIILPCLNIIIFSLPVLLASFYLLLWDDCAAQLAVRPFAQANGHPHPYAHGERARLCCVHTTADTYTGSSFIFGRRRRRWSIRCRKKFIAQQSFPSIHHKKKRNKINPGPAWWMDRETWPLEAVHSLWDFPINSSQGCVFFWASQPNKSSHLRGCAALLCPQSSITSSFLSLSPPTNANDLSSDPPFRVPAVLLCPD